MICKLVGSELNEWNTPCNSGFWSMTRRQSFRRLHALLAPTMQRSTRWVNERLEIVVAKESLLELSINDCPRPRPSCFTRVQPFGVIRRFPDTSLYHPCHHRCCRVIHQAIQAVTFQYQCIAGRAVAQTRFLCQDPPLDNTRLTSQDGRIDTFM